MTDALPSPDRRFRASADDHPHGPHEGRVLRRRSGTAVDDRRTRRLEFQLGWLEGLDDNDRDRRFGIVASGLALQRKSAPHPFVMTGERPFPLASVSSEEQMRMQRPIPTEEYTARIAPRLIALERTEPEPKVVPDVLAVWGLAPRSAASFLPDA